MALLVACHATVGRADDIDGPGLLQKLRDLDAAYTAKLTIEGTEVRTPPYPGVSPMTMKVTFTIAGNRCAVVQEAVELPKVKFLPETPRQRRRSLSTNVVVHHKGKRLVHLMTKRTVFLGPVFCSSVRTSTVLLVDRDGKVEVLGENRIIDLYRPDSLDLVGSRDYRLWGIGRGFSRYIDEITRVEKRPDGLLAASAVGSFAQPGTWALTVNPDEAYLVHDAKFTPRGLSRPAVTIANKGLRRIGTACFPEEGAWVFPIALTQGEQAKPKSIRFEADSKLLAVAEKLVRGPHPPKTWVSDERVHPPLYHEVKPGQRNMPPEFLRSLTTTRPVKWTDKQMSTFSPTRPRPPDRPGF